jgi:light-independent protochlorophyllide reductase subunit B
MSPKLRRCLEEMGMDVNVVAPMGARPSTSRLGAAHFNVLLYPETAEGAARWAEKALGQPYTKVIPIGAGATRDFIAECARCPGHPARR